MSEYRRSRHGQIYFFTVVTYQRQPILCLEKSKAALKSAIAETRLTHPFLIHAWVLLPDHLHCIWELPDGDRDYSKRWGMIKTKFSKQAKTFLTLPEPSASRARHRESTIWQRRFWEHTIRDELDFTSH